MIKFSVLLLIIFIAALGYLAILNNETVALKISEQVSFEIPKIALILLSIALGALSILALVIFRDTAPVPAGGCVEGHQVGKPDIDCAHGEPYNCQGCAKG